MKIEIVEWYSRELVMNNPNKLFIFGDNTHRTGTGGQAIIRGLPNTFGIATKLKPSQLANSYFKDTPSHFEMIHNDIKQLKDIMNTSKTYNTIIFPKDGIGTGLSRMPKECPALFKYMNELLLENFGFDNCNGTLNEIGISHFE